MDGSGELRRLIRVGAVAAVLLHATVGRARGESIADGLFCDGRGGLNAGDAAEGCADLSESQRLDPSVGTLLNLAICEEQLGHVATAWSKYREVQKVAPPDDERAAIAHHGMVELEPKVPWLRIQLGPTCRDCVVKLDGKAV